MKLNKLATCIIPVLAGNGGVSLEYSYPSADDIPEGFEALYTEVDGTFKLTGVRGLKTPDDVTALQGALSKERNDHSETKRKFKAFDGMEIDEVLSKLDRIQELEAASGGNLDDDAIDKIVEARIQSRLNPLNRQIQDLTTTNSELTEQVSMFEKTNKQRQVKDALSEVGRKYKVTEHAFEDMLVIGGMQFDVDEHGNVITNDASGAAGLNPEVWLTEQQKKRPHWFPTSEGAGATGGKGGGGRTNPFTHDNWNMTEQGKLFKENPDLAHQMAKAAGTSVGGQRPAAKK